MVFSRYDTQDNFHIEEERIMSVDVIRNPPKEVWTAVKQLMWRKGVEGVLPSSIRVPFLWGSSFPLYKVTHCKRSFLEKKRDLGTNYYTYFVGFSPFFLQKTERVVIREVSKGVWIPFKGFVFDCNGSGFTFAAVHGQWRTFEMARMHNLKRLLELSSILIVGVKCSYVWFWISSIDWPASVCRSLTVRTCVWDQTDWGPTHENWDCRRKDGKLQVQGRVSLSPTYYQVPYNVLVVSFKVLGEPWVSVNISLEKTVLYLLRTSVFEVFP